MEEEQILTNRNQKPVPNHQVHQNLEISNRKLRRKRSPPKQLKGL